MLAGLGILAANAMGVDYFQNKQRQDLVNSLPGLLGTPESARAGDEGPVQIPGSGLMADPSNIANQFKFAQGLLSQRGGAQMLQSFGPMLAAAIQGKQFQQGQDLQREFHGDQMTWQGKEFDAARANEQRLADQWKATFDQNAAQNAFARQMEQARLNFSYSQAADEKKFRQQQLDQANQPKLPSGYGIVPTATGPSMAPMPGTQDYKNVVEGHQALKDAVSAIDELRDMYSGPETPTPGGNTVRVGGSGNEWWGQDRAAMNAKRNSIIANLGKARDMGTLQPSDYKMLEASLPAVDSWVPTRQKNFDIAYKGVRDEFQKKIDAQLKANPWLVPPPPKGYH